MVKTKRSKIRQSRRKLNKTRRTKLGRIKTRRTKLGRTKTRRIRGGDLTSSIINGIDKKALCMAALADNPETLLALGLTRIEKGCDMLVKEYAEILPEIEKHPEKAIPIIMKHMMNSSAKLFTSFANDATNGKFSILQKGMLNVARQATNVLEKMDAEKEDTSEGTSEGTSEDTSS